MRSGSLGLEGGVCRAESTVPMGNRHLQCPGGRKARTPCGIPGPRVPAIPSRGILERGAPEPDTRQRQGRGRRERTVPEPPQPPQVPQHPGWRPLATGLAGFCKRWAGSGALTVWVSATWTFRAFPGGCDRTACRVSPRLIDTHYYISRFFWFEKKSK